MTKRADCLCLPRTIDTGPIGFDGDNDLFAACRGSSGPRKSFEEKTIANDNAIALAA